MAAFGETELVSVLLEEPLLPGKPVKGLICGRGRFALGCRMGNCICGAAVKNSDGMVSSIWDSWLGFNVVSASCRWKLWLPSS